MSHDPVDMMKKLVNIESMFNLRLIELQFHERAALVSGRERDWGEFAERIAIADRFGEKLSQDLDLAYALAKGERNEPGT